MRNGSPRVVVWLNSRPMQSIKMALRYLVWIGLMNLIHYVVAVHPLTSICDACRRPRRCAPAAVGVTELVCETPPSIQSPHTKQRGGKKEEALSPLQHYTHLINRKKDQGNNFSINTEMGIWRCSAISFIIRWSVPTRSGE